MLETLRWMLFGALGAYALSVAGAWMMQPRLVYFPAAFDPDDGDSPAQVGLAYEDVWLQTHDGQRLHGWWVPSARDSAQTLLFFHGNAGSIAHRLQSLKLFHGLDLNILIIDYRGYGASTGQPNEQGTYTDAQTAWRYLTEKRKIDADNIIVFGRSLGAAMASWLAEREHPAAVILESAFTSLPAVGQRVYWWLPVRWLSRIHYDNLARIANIRAPLLIAHSADDELIPIEQGRMLYERARAPKEFLNMVGPHATAHLDSGQRYIDGLRQFIHSLEQPRDG